MPNGRETVRVTSEMISVSLGEDVATPEEAAEDPERELTTLDLTPVGFVGGTCACR
jgi:hypothetical protein